MTAYLDNNIVVLIENGTYTIDKILSLLPDKQTKFFYSAAHIQEAKNFQGSATMTKTEFLGRRFETIRSIFKNNYLYFDITKKRQMQLIRDPLQVYETISFSDFGTGIMKMFVNLFSKDQKEGVRKNLGLDIQRLNNYSPSEVIKQLNSKLTSWGTNESFLELIEHAVRLHPDGKNFGLHNRVAAIFELLDLFGYWKDRETDNSNYARLWDADHTINAAYCDYFISDDRRTRYKANVVYDIYKIGTVIISAQNK